jgi:1-acyl-sn-glycerol-3-phosphate acyltransferase
MRAGLKRFYKVGFFAITKLVILVFLGLRIQHKERLPLRGPAILVANHNSHLDTFVLMALFPLWSMHLLRPVANQAYFLEQNRWLAWFARDVIDIIPVSCELSKSTFCKSSEAHRDFLKCCTEALSKNQILILYPEGSRGLPEQLGEFRSGIAHLAKLNPQVPIVPIFLHGLGKALPKGEVIPVPFLCSVKIGAALHWCGQKQVFLQTLKAQMSKELVDVESS